MLSHSANYSFAVIDYDLYGIYISILKLKCINHAGKRLGTALGALEKKVRRYFPDDAISCCMYRKSEVLQQLIPSHMIIVESHV